jgi:stage II sporulation protein AA (anti-sigma F factor antagonist)
MVSGGARLIVLDLRRVSYMDSTCLGELIDVRMTLKRHGGQLRLVNVPAHVQRLLDISRLSDVLDGRDSQPDEQRANGSVA